MSFDGDESPLAIDPAQSAWESSESSSEDSESLGLFGVRKKNCGPPGLTET